VASNAHIERPYMDCVQRASGAKTDRYVQITTALERADWEKLDKLARSRNVARGVLARELLTDALARLGAT
jgi:predicted DNA-binding ribbon-helix-helix protein